MKFNFSMEYEPPKQWDEFLLTNEFPEISQSKAFGDHLRDSGFTPFYIQISTKNEKIGQCLFFTKDNQIASWNYGPILKSRYSIHTNEILIAFAIFLKNNGYYAIENSKTQKLIRSNLESVDPFPLSFKHGESPVIEINRSLDEIKCGFDRSARGKINKCEKNGIEVVLSEDNSLIEPYENLLRDYRIKRNFSMPFLYPNTATMRRFNSNSSSMGIALAKFGDVILAGMGFITFGNILTELALATSDEFYRFNFPVNDFLKYRAIAFYKQKGITLYDIAGGEKNPSDPKKKDILTFKKKFSTCSAKFILIDRKVLSPLWYPYAIKRKFLSYLSNT